MNEHPLLAQLAQFTGGFIAADNQSQEQLQAFHSDIAQVLLQQQPAEQLHDPFQFETIENFNTQNIQADDLHYLNNVLLTAGETQQQDILRAFRREVPFVSPVVSKSVPSWGRGAKIQKTIGPLINTHGQKFYYDFYKVVPHVKLFLSGAAEPALVLSVEVETHFFIFQNYKDYTIPASSIWINAHLFSSSAPDNEFCGLTVKSGTLHFTKNVHLTNGVMTAPAGTIVTVTLELVQQVDNSVSPDETGIDAKNAVIQLPQSFSFSFSDSGTQVLSAGDASWTLYEEPDSFTFDSNTPATYFAPVNGVFISYKSSNTKFDAIKSQSIVCDIRGSAPIFGAAWGLTCAAIDINNPLEANGIGAMIIRTGKGLEASWRGLEDINETKREWIALRDPWISLDPGHISIMDIDAHNIYAKQKYKLWKNKNDQWNTITLHYTDHFVFLFNCLQAGIEAVMTQANCTGAMDRPVDVAGNPFSLNSKQTIFLLTWSQDMKLVFLYDDNLLVDDSNANQKSVTFKSQALALNNAVLTVSPITGFLLVGALKDGREFSRTILIETFGLLGYLPILPDPYAADIGIFDRVYRRFGEFQDGNIPLAAITQLLVCFIGWENADIPRVNFIWGDIFAQSAKSSSPYETNYKLVKVPLDLVAHKDLALQRTREMTARQSELLISQYKKAGITPPDVVQDNRTIEKESTHERVYIPLADQDVNYTTGSAEVNETIDENAAAGDSVASEYEVAPSQQYLRANDRVQQAGLFSLLDVSTKAHLLGVNIGFVNDRLIFGRTYDVQPVDTSKNPLAIFGMDVVATSRFVRLFTVPQISWEPVLNITPPFNITNDPPFGILTYANDGIPAIIGNTGINPVPLAPIPATRDLIREYRQDKLKAWSLFTLANGMVSLGRYNQTNHYLPKPNDEGASIQLIDAHFKNGTKAGLQISTRAGINPNENNKVFEGFTDQLFNVNALFSTGTWSILGKTVTDIFNNEFGTNGVIARGVPVERYDFTGYGAQVFSHWLNNNAEIAQVSQSIFDIWKGRVAKEIIQVRSLIYPWAIRVVRTITMYRSSTGFEYRVDSGWRADSDGIYDFTTKDEPGIDYVFHPGLVRGVYNVKNIVENNLAPYNTTWFKTYGVHVDPNDGTAQPVGAGVHLKVQLIPVYFDADVMITDVDGTAAGAGGVPTGQFVPSTQMLGYLQVAPEGVIISAEDFANILDLQNGLGGPVDCTVNINGSGQKMRISRVEINHSLDETSMLVFVAAAKGMPVLPKDGSWSLVAHSLATKQVVPITGTTVSLIRKGVLRSADDVLNSAFAKEITAASELFKKDTDRLLQFGLLQNTDTQKVLYRNPFFQAGEQLLHSTMPDLGDAYRLLNSTGVFPNIDNLPSIDLDAGGCATKIISEGYQMVDKAATNVLKKLTQKFPSDASFTFIDKPGILKVYVEYASTDKDGNSSGDGLFNLDLDSQANKWLNQMNNVTMVVDLVSMKRLFMIQGKFDTQKGSAPKFNGPKLIPGKDLAPIIDILEILEAIGSSPDYASIVAKGLQIAMSNSPNNWEYKFQADKEIPVVQFPPAYLDGPTTPLRLEANMKLGVYFNLAVPIPPDGLPGLSAGGFIEFGAKLSVMCVSIAAATVYAVGQVTLRISADTVNGPGLYMKMGFGVELMVGIPVVGNVSVLFEVGVEISLDTSQITVGAFILFRGEASLIGGLVTITIQIEASGKVHKTLTGPNQRTDCIAQVTFSIDVCILFVIDISDTESWQEARQIA